MVHEHGPCGACASRDVRHRHPSGEASYLRIYVTTYLHHIGTTGVPCPNVIEWHGWNIVEDDWIVIGHDRIFGMEVQPMFLILSNTHEPFGMRVLGYSFLG